MLEIKAHPYQEKARDEILNRLLTQKQQHVLLISPISSGKTFIAADVANEWVKRFPDQKVLIIANRITLIPQAYETLNLFNSGHAIIHGELKKDLDGNKIRNLAKIKDGKVIGIEDFDYKILTTMISTFINHHNMMADYKPDLIILDEAHKATSEAYQIIKDKFPESKMLGLTATPYRAKSEDGECLYDDWYGNNIVETISIKELIELGQLTQPIYIVKNNEDHVINSWLNLTKNEENRRTIVFCRNTEHVMEMVKAFELKGISAAAITTSDEVCKEAEAMSITKRNSVYKDFRDGKIEVLVSIDALTEGFNEPLARYCFLLRDIGGDDANNPALYTQIVGRVLRSHPDKNDAFIVDFYNSVKRYGPVEEWDWDIRKQGKKQTKSVVPGDRVRGKDHKHYRLYMTCGVCAHVYHVQEHSSCSHCGSKNEIQVCETEYELYRVDEWLSSDPHRKPGKVNGLYGKYLRWARSEGIKEIDLGTFGQCMTELTKDGKLKKIKSFMGMKGIFYEVS